MVNHIWWCAVLIPFIGPLKSDSLAASENAAAQPTKPTLLADLQPKREGTLPPQTIPESSGLIRSAKHPHLFWTHNDSGSNPELLAIDAKGQLVATVKIPVPSATDWEDIAMDGSGRIIVADTGNNLRNRGILSLHRFKEPDPKNPAEKIEGLQTFRFRFPANTPPFDAEAIIACQSNVIVFTKELERTQAFLVDLSENPAEATIVAQRIAETKNIVTCTGADLSPDGRRLALLTYSAVFLMELPQTWASKPEMIFEGEGKQIPILIGQCEGIAWDDHDLVITTEQNPLFRTPGSIWRIKTMK